MPSRKQTHTVYRKDYRSYPFTIKKIQLHFTLSPEHTVVSNTMSIERIRQGEKLLLNGEDIHIDSIHINHKPCTDYEFKNNVLTINPHENTFELTITSSCKPLENSTLMGLYISGNHFFTQCEAEGFRRITFFPDRPDVMSEYFVTINANKQQYPMLLSNGNLISQQEVGDGRHEAVWHDPFLKPCYLFALVAGDFDIREKASSTRSGRPVLLQVYSDKGNGDQTLWALDSLERAMQWDEKRFGLALDLDRFMIVAARDFNMGAMENKGLNIFNAAYVLADPNTATDANYDGIESVVGHEYFHNWTGNRVTCQDWFQLSLKEGLTVFRDQEFSADMMANNLPEKAARSAKTVKRIADVSALRAAQFPEDAGPMAHPIRPDSYQEIGNFYTATVYEKGAEIIRMQHTLLGEKGFRAGMDEYFRRHDGQAVTCDDFVNAMESIYTQQHPGKNFDIFRHWYSQAGTPRVNVRMNYDAAQQTCLITLRQTCEKVGVEKLTPDLHKKPFHIPFHIGMLSANGNAIPLDTSTLENATTTENNGVLLELKEQEQTWLFNAIPERPILSLLRDFSAPVYVDYDNSVQELAVLCAHDSNPFSRWEATQELCSREIIRLTHALLAQGSTQVDPIIHHVWQHNLNDTAIDAAYRACLLTLPSEKVLAERLHVITPRALYEAKKQLQQQLGEQHRQAWLNTYKNAPVQTEYRPDAISAGNRSLKNIALSYLLRIQDPDGIAFASAQYEQAHNMTDRMGALSALVYHRPKHISAPHNENFYHRFKGNPLVIDKWFALQATAATSLNDIRQLMQDPLFTLRNPNRARALLFQFCINNTNAFHTDDGQAYAFWAEQVCALDTINPEIAARFARILDNWQRYAEPTKTLMQNALHAIEKHPNLSKNTREVIGKALYI